MKELKKLKNYVIIKINKCKLSMVYTEAVNYKAVEFAIARQWTHGPKGSDVNARFLTEFYF